MRIPKYSFEEGIKIYNLGDVHRGNKTCNANLFNKTIQQINQEENSRWVSTGDILEVALKNSKSDVYSAMNPEEEFSLITKELTPIKDKCLGIVESNHHARFKKDTGMSLDKYLCKSLGIEDKFLGAVGLISVMCGSAKYYLALHHGVGGGRLRGSKTTSLNRFADVLNGADVYLEGHTHAFDHFVDSINYIDKKRGIVQTFNAHFVTTGHYLEWEGSYAQNMKLKAMPLGCAVAELFPSDYGRYSSKKIKVDLFS